MSYSANIWLDLEVLLVKTACRSFEPQQISPQAAGKTSLCFDGESHSKVLVSVLDKVSRGNSGQNKLNSAGRNRKKQPIQGCRRLHLSKIKLLSCDISALISQESLALLCMLEKSQNRQRDHRNHSKQKKREKPKLYILV